MLPAESKDSRLGFETDRKDDTADYETSSRRLPQNVIRDRQESWDTLRVATREGEILAPQYYHNNQTIVVNNVQEGATNITSPAIMVEENID